MEVVIVIIVIIVARDHLELALPITGLLIEVGEKIRQVTQCLVFKMFNKFKKKLVERSFLEPGMFLIMCYMRLNMMHLKGTL